MIGKVEDVERPKDGQQRHDRGHELLQQRCKQCTEHHDGEEACGNSCKIRQRPTVSVVHSHGMAADGVRAWGECGDEGKQKR